MGFPIPPFRDWIVQGDGWASKTLAVRDDEKAQMVLTGNSNAFINHG